jgi:hypothetical protein
MSLLRVLFKVLLVPVRRDVFHLTRLFISVAFLSRTARPALLAQPPTRHVGTARRWSPETRRLSRPRPSHRTHHCPTRHRRDHAPMPWPWHGLVMAGTGRVRGHGPGRRGPGMGWVPEQAFVIRVLFSIHDCLVFIHPMIE